MLDSLETGWIGCMTDICSFQDSSAVPAVFHQALISFKTKPIPISAAVISLLSYFQNVVWISQSI